MAITTLAYHILHVVNGGSKYNLLWFDYIPRLPKSTATKVNYALVVFFYPKNHPHPPSPVGEWQRWLKRNFRGCRNPFPPKFSSALA